MIPIIRQELWQRKWYSFFWIIGVAAFIALVIGVYPAFRHQSAQLNKSLNQLPAAVKSLAADTNENLLSPVGYMSSNVYYLMLPILYGIVAIGLGGSILARDEQNHTLELLLSRPVSRTKVLAAKALAGITILAMIAAGTILATVVLAWLTNLGLSLWHLTLATIMAALMALVFGALAFTLTAIGHSARIASVGVSVLLLVASYLFTSLAGTVHWLKWPSTLLPYHYYHPSPIMDGSFTGKAALGMLGVIVIFALIAVLTFRHRDID